MRHYQAKKSKYTLPHNAYMRAVYAVRHFGEREKELRAAPISGNKSDYYSNAEKEIESIKQALEQIPMEYRRGVWRNVTRQEWFPIDADVRTYQRQKQRFLYSAAVRLGYFQEGASNR